MPIGAILAILENAVEFRVVGFWPVRRAASETDAVGEVLRASGLFFDVFATHDPSNRLLDEARREVIEQQSEVRRQRDAMESAQHMTPVLRETERLTPLAFSLYARSGQRALGQAG